MKFLKLAALPLIAALALTSCHKGADNLTPEQKDSIAQVAWMQYNDSLNNYFQNECQSEAEADSAIAKAVVYAMDLARDNAGQSICYTVLGDLYYYMDIAQREELFSLVDTDSLEAHKLDKFYSAFQAEKLTSVSCMFTDFGALTPEGDSLYVSQLVGQTDYLLIDFWASWCGPCRASMPGLKEVYAEAGGRLQILGVSLDKEKENWTGAIETLGLPWKQISDLQGWACAPAALYGVVSIPSTVLLDKDGKIVARNAHAEEIRAILAK